MSIAATTLRCCASVATCGRLLLYADGLVESREAHGHFLPEYAISTALLASDCDQALDTLMKAVDWHTGGHAHDDMALLLLEHGASLQQRQWTHSGWGYPTDGISSGLG